MTNIEKQIERMGWMPIESAPKDETEILLKCWINEAVDAYSICKGFLSEEYQDWFEFDSSSNPLYNKPSFWMPIPTGKEGEVVRVLYDCIKTLNNPNIRYTDSNDVVKLMDDALAKAEQLAGK